MKIKSRISSTIQINEQIDIYQHLGKETRAVTNYLFLKIH